MTQVKKITKTELRRQLKYNVIKMMEAKGFWCDDEGSNITFGHSDHGHDYTFWYRPSHSYIMYDYDGCQEDMDYDINIQCKGIEDDVNEMITNFCKTNNL